MSGMYIPTGHKYPQGIKAGSRRRSVEVYSSSDCVKVGAGVEAGDSKDVMYFVVLHEGHKYPKGINTQRAQLRTAVYLILNYRHARLRSGITWYLLYQALWVGTQCKPDPVRFIHCMCIYFED